MLNETRAIRRMEGFITFVVLQVGWFSSVVGAARGFYWLGPSVVGVLCVLHLGYSYSWAEDLKLMVALALFGTLADSLQSALGLLNFQGSWWSWLCPLWISLLWLHFGTLRQSFFRLFRGRLALAALLGALAGPLSYWAGARLGAVTFHPNPWWTVLSVALVWGTVLPAATYWTFRRERGSKGNV